MTNAERFRSMTDDELAKLLFGFCDNSERCYFCPLYDVSCGGQTNEETWQDFMKQEVSNGKTD